MKNIITAIGNEELNKRLCGLESIIVKERDIFYKEGILEYLEENHNIDIVIFNRKLCEKNELSNFLRCLVSYDIEIFLLLENKDSYDIQDFENFKDIKLFFSEEEIFNEFDEKSYTDREDRLNCYSKKIRIISVLGSFGVGKTSISSILGKYLSQKYKVLIIDFDILNNSLKTLFDIKTKLKYDGLNSLISKVGKKLYVLTDIKYYFNENNKINIHKVKEMIEELKEMYDYIIIDTSSEIKMKYMKTIFPSCDFNIFLIEANIMEAKKSNDLLEVYSMDFDLDLSKSGIIINKNNSNSIDENILKNTFSEISFLGKINYSNDFNNYINTHTKINVKSKNLEKIMKGVL